MKKMKIINLKIMNIINTRKKTLYIQKNNLIILKNFKNKLIILMKKTNNLNLMKINKIKIKKNIIYKEMKKLKKKIIKFSKILI
jgi:hypothetical protein